MASSSLASATNAHTSFLDLPAELRQNILLETLYSHDVLHSVKLYSPVWAQALLDLLDLDIMRIDLRSNGFVKVHQALSADVLWASCQRRKQAFTLRLETFSLEYELRYEALRHGTYNYGGRSFGAEELIEHVKGDMVALEMSSRS